MVIEMHYDNPRGQESMISLMLMPKTIIMLLYLYIGCALYIIDVIDSSGIRFFYVSEPREHDAGVLYLGHSVFPTMIIPPDVDNYTISGVCGAQCTERVPLFTSIV